jgi:hypothetical protein
MSFAYRARSNIAVVALSICNRVTFTRRVIFSSHFPFLTSKLHYSVRVICSRSVVQKQPLIMRLLHALLCSIGTAAAVLEPNYTSPAGVEIYNPSTFFNATGPWSLMSKAGNTLYIAGAYCPSFPGTLQKPPTNGKFMIVGTQACVVSTGRTAPSP